MVCCNQAPDCSAQFFFAIAVSMIGWCALVQVGMVVVGSFTWFVGLLAFEIVRSIHRKRIVAQYYRDASNNVMVANPLEAARKSRADKDAKATKAAIRTAAQPPGGQKSASGVSDAGKPGTSAALTEGLRFYATSATLSPSKSTLAKTSGTGDGAASGGVSTSRLPVSVDSEGDDSTRSRTKGSGTGSAGLSSRPQADGSGRGSSGTGSKRLHLRTAGAPARDDDSKRLPVDSEVRGVAPGADDESAGGAAQNSSTGSSDPTTRGGAPGGGRGSTNPRLTVALSFTKPLRVVGSPEVDHRDPLVRDAGVSVELNPLFVAAAAAGRSSSRRGVAPDSAAPLPPGLSSSSGLVKKGSSRGVKKPMVALPPPGPPPPSRSPPSAVPVSARKPLSVPRPASLTTLGPGARASSGVRTHQHSAPASPGALSSR